MRVRNGWLRFAVAAWGVALGRPALGEVEPTKTVNVACARGESIAHALALGDERKPLVVVVHGTCTEPVAIARSDVTLRAGPGGGGVAADDPAADAVTVTASRVTLDGLTITSRRSGVVATAAAGLTIRNTNVSSTGRNGVAFISGTSGSIEGCTVQGNARDGVVVEASSAVIVGSLVSDNGRMGIAVVNGGSARIGIDAVNGPAGSVVRNNGSDGVIASMGGSLYLAMTEVSGNGTDPAAVAGRIGVVAAAGTATLIGGNTVSGNAGAGVTASRGGSITIGDPSFGLTTMNTITGNGAAGSSGGVFAFLGSTILVRDAVITGNYGFGLGLSLRSQGQLLSSTVQGNRAPGGDGIRLLMGSALLLGAPGTNAADNAGWGLQCLDGESSVMNTVLLTLSGNLAGGISPTCTAF